MTTTVVDNMHAIKWWDSKLVYFLTVDGTIELDRVARKERVGEKQEVVSPRVIKDYHAFVGGVDVHDQLRLHR